MSKTLEMLAESEKHVTALHHRRISPKRLVQLLNMMSMYVFTVFMQIAHQSNIARTYLIQSHANKCKSVCVEFAEYSLNGKIHPSGQRCCNAVVIPNLRNSYQKGWEQH
jgi:hypothetical protein